MKPKGKMRRPRVTASLEVSSPKRGEVWKVMELGVAKRVSSSVSSTSAMDEATVKFRPALESLAKK